MSMFPTTVTKQLFRSLGSMGKYKKKMPVIEAFQWFKNGDHPLDESTLLMTTEKGDILTEGKVVRFFRHPKVEGSEVCACGRLYDEHGFLDNSLIINKVCPGDYILSGRNRFNVVKKEEFEAIYEEVEA